MEVDDPNKRNYNFNHYKWSSISDVDTFLSNFNHDNNYTNGDIKLNIGDIITITDGIYNIWWIIAGFDLEHNRTAADGTVYDNGYGIMLYPYYTYTACYWNTDNTTSGGYYKSLAHSTTNAMATDFKNNILGTHLINRNVLLSSSIDSNGIANGFTWTTAYGTIPSMAQLFTRIDYYGSYDYDNGEAVYKLPLFNYNELIIRYGKYNYWLRNIDKKSNSDYNVFYMDGNGNYNPCATNYSVERLHPLLYIR